MKTNLLPIITSLVIAATVASGEKPVEVYRSGYSRVILIVVEGHKYLLFEGLDKGGITHAASCTNHAPPIVTQSCQRTHCDTPADLCAKRGHQWRAGCGMTGCATIHPAATRHCSVCGIYEAQPQADWPHWTNGIIIAPNVVTTNDDWIYLPNIAVSGNWHNLPTWPGTYATNYVTNINANVEAP